MKTLILLVISIIANISIGQDTVKFEDENKFYFYFEKGSYEINLNLSESSRTASPIYYFCDKYDVPVFYKIFRTNQRESTDTIHIQYEEMYEFNAFVPFPARMFIKKIYYTNEI